MSAPDARVRSTVSALNARLAALTALLASLREKCAHTPSAELYRDMTALLEQQTRVQNALTEIVMHDEIVFLEAEIGRVTVEYEEHQKCLQRALPGCVKETIDSLQQEVSRCRGALGWMGPELEKSVQRHAEFVASTRT